MSSEHSDSPVLDTNTTVNYDENKKPDFIDLKPMNVK